METPEVKFHYNPDEKYYFVDTQYPNVINIQKAYGKIRKEDGWEVVLYHFIGQKNVSASNPITVWRGKYLNDAKMFVRELVHINDDYYHWSVW